jgi:hypothetical protein
MILYNADCSSQTYTRKYPLAHIVIYFINLGNTVDSKTRMQTALLFLLRNQITRCKRIKQQLSCPNTVRLEPQRTMDVKISSTKQKHNEPQKRIE